MQSEIIHDPKGSGVGRVHVAQNIAKWQTGNAPNVISINAPCVGSKKAGRSGFHKMKKGNDPFVETQYIYQPPKPMSMCKH
jgi:hypothetical protein